MWRGLSCGFQAISLGILGPFLCVTIIENVGFACDFQKVSGALVEELIMTNNKVIIKFKKE